MPRYRRYGPNFSQRQRPPFAGAVWLIGLAVLFYTGHWWPGILILVGISMVLSTAWRGSEKQAPPNDDFKMPNNQPAPWTVMPPAPTSAPAPVNNSARVDLLPSTCPRCGAPVRSNEVKWMNTQSATCSYCGSTLTTSRNKPAA